MSFDRLAPAYLALERFLAGHQMQRCRVAHLPRLRPCRHALLLGEGPGRFLVALLGCQPAVQVTCVESSPGMIAAAQRHARAHEVSLERVEFVPVDVLQWVPPAARFDLVATHFFLDCFSPEELASVVSRVADAATPEAQWLLSDFGLPPGGWQRQRARLLLWGMYRFFRLVTGLSAVRWTDPAPILEAVGFRLLERCRTNFGFIHGDYWQRPRS